MTGCPGEEALLAAAHEGSGPLLAHATDCPRCQALLQRHLSLEVELRALADPQPPSDLVGRVMVRVGQLDQRTAELRAGLWILGLSLALGCGAFALAGVRALAVPVADLAVLARGQVAPLVQAVFAGWAVAPLPMSAALSGFVFAALAVLRSVSTTSLSAHRELS